MDNMADVDERDVVERDCGIKPTAFMGPWEWVDDGSKLPFESNKSPSPGCYSFCAVADDGSIKHLYIGKAKHMRSRMYGHNRSGLFDRCFEWCDDNNCWFMMSFWLSDNRSALESELINKLHPLFNKQDA